MTPDELARWADNARPGDAVEYYRGELGRTIENMRADERDLHVGTIAWQLHELGVVTLLQRPGAMTKNTCREFHYLAVRR